jgi:hypothetical protein
LGLCTIRTKKGRIKTKEKKGSIFCFLGNPNLIFNLQVKIKAMGFDQYHEPPGELSQDVRTFARMIRSLIEEAEAIDWYEQRLSVEKDGEAKKIMEQTQKEEFIHFAMDLEFLLRRKKKWRIIMKNVLFKSGDIVENGEKAEQEVE